MRTLAKFCLSCGMQVSGSDRQPSAALESLKSAGVHVFPPQEVAFIPECDAVVYSAAVPQSDAQLAAARAAHVPTLERKAFLGLVSRLFDRTLAVAGTHGKTTVTAMICAIFERAGFAFSGHIGGEVCGAENGGAVFRGREWLVSEACEYNRSFLTLAPFVTVVLNMQFDHPDCYRDYEDMKEAYQRLIKNTCVRGYAVCYEPLLRELDLSGRRVVTFGYSRSCDVYAEEITYADGKYSFYICKCGKRRLHVRLLTEGKHNVLNALAAYAAASECGATDADCEAALAAFPGVKGRYEHAGRAASGAEMVCDHAHHPGEIEAAVATAVQGCRGKVFVIFEPHTFSRTRALMKEFVAALSLADETVILPTFKAREEYTPSGSGYDLYMHLKLSGGVRCSYARDYKAAAEAALRATHAGDIILILGAGEVRKTAEYM